MHTRNIDPRIALLRSIELFRRCSDKELRQVQSVTCPVTIKAGTVIFVQGTVGREAFIILSGEVVVAIDGIEITRLGAGEVCGEMALLDSGFRSATVTAVTDVEVLALSQGEFHRLLDLAPKAARKIMAQLSSRLRQMSVPRSA